MKRKCTSHAGRPRKKAHLLDQSATATPPPVEQPVLQRFYPRLLTLRHHLLAQLPKTSKNRRRKLAQLGLPSASKSASSTSDVDLDLGQLLDSTVVGDHNTKQTEAREQLAVERTKDMETFTQQRSPAITGGTFKPGYFLQAEVGHDMLMAAQASAKMHRLLTL